jgi:hypothetical protein
MKDEKNEQNEQNEDIINLLNTNFDSLKIEEKENLIKSQKDENNNNNSFIEKIDSLNSDEISEHSNANSQLTSQGTFASEKFNQEKDLDLPNFTATKNAPFIWKIFHIIFYLFYNVFLLISSCIWISKNYGQFNTFLSISHIGYFLSSIMLWLYHRRGCIANANLNTQVKSNVDKSFKARILRSETGWIYFFSLFGSIIFLYGNICFSTKEYNNKFLIDFYNINFVGTLILSVTQIYKIGQALTENREYIIKNDISRSIVEILLFFGSLFFGTSYLIQIAYSFDVNNYFTMIMGFKLTGNCLIILSGITMFYRYFCSSHQDLNSSDISNLSL